MNCSGNNQELSPNDLKLYEWYSKLSIQIKITFYSTLIIGCFTHLYFFMHKFTNEDDIMGLSAPVDYTGLGRWFSDNVASIRTEYKIPFVIGILCMLYLSFAAVALVDTLQIESVISCSLIGALMITFPTISYTLGYLVSSDGGAFAIMMAILAVWITKKINKGYILGSIFLCLSLGTYYAYMGLAIGLSLLLLLKLALEKKKSIRVIASLAGKLITMGVGGVSLYLIITKITLSINNLTLPSYKGLDSMGKISIEMIPQLLEKSYKNFFGFFVGNYIYISDWLNTLIIIIFMGAVISLVIIVINKGIYKNYKLFIGTILCIGLFPLGVNIVDFIAPDSGTYTMTLYPFVLIFIMPIIIFDIMESMYYNLNEKFKKLYNILIGKGVPMVCLMIIFQFYLLNNLYYLKADIFYQRTYAIHNRVLSRIEEVAEFSKGAPVAIMGTLPNLNYPDASEMFSTVYNDYGLGAQYIGISGNGNNVVYNSQEFAMFCDQFLGVPVTSITQEQYEEIRFSDMFMDMPIWPEEGSIKVIDNIIVVNMNYNLAIDIRQVNKNMYIFEHKFHNTMPEDTQYAWYVYKDGEHIDTKWYTSEPFLEYVLDENSEYQILMFVAKDNREIGQSFSNTVSIK